jgi:DNA-binding transcriptional LysR family regulator
MDPLAVNLPNFIPFSKSIYLHLIMHVVHGWMSLRGVDLNLLPILQALLNKGSVTLAARSLGLSQPATSHALGRLRHLFGDRLLVKVGREMRLTAKAKKLRVMADAACSVIEMLVAPDAFDPANTIAKYSVATTDHMALILGQDLLPMLRAEAPGMSVSFVDAGLSVHDQLRSGAVDLAVVARVPGLFDGLSADGSFIDPLVCACGLEHPLSGQLAITAEQLSAYPLLRIDSVPNFRIPPTPHEFSEPIMVSASHLMVLPILAAKTGAMTVIPRSMAQQVAEHAALKIIPLAGATVSLEHCTVWNPVHDSDAAHSWLRSKLNDILQLNFS